MEGVGLNLGPRGQMLVGDNLARDYKVPSGFMDPLRSQRIRPGEGAGTVGANWQTTRQPRGVGWGPKAARGTQARGLT